MTQRAVMNHITIPTNGTELHVVTSGAGIPIVLIHGFPQSWFEWRKIIPSLAESYQVIAPDLRGMGDSKVMTSGQDKKTLAADIYGMLRSMNISRAIVVGHDWGGAVAQRLALDYPECAAALICINIPYFPVLPDLNQTKWPAAQLKYSWYIFFSQAEYLAEQIIERAGDLIIAWFLEHGRSKDSEPATGDEVAEYSRWLRQPERARAALNLYRSWLDRDGADWALLSDKVLNLPVLWIHGMQDPLVVPSYLNLLPALIPGVRIERFENCGHWVPEEQPVQLVQKIHQFLVDIKTQ